MVSVQEKINRGIKINFIDPLLGLLRLKTKSDEEVQQDTLSKQGLLNHDNFRHQTQASLRFKLI